MRARREAILFQSHLATAIRQMQKNKVFSFITIFALSTSITACLLIFQYASFELSFDRYYPKASSLYRINLRTYENGILRNESATVPVDALSEIRQNVTGIEASAQFATTAWWFTCSFTYREGNTSRTFNERNVAYTTHSAIDMFDLQITSGNAKDALVAPFTMVISESTAIKYFGDEDPVGKVLHFRGSSDVHDYVVTAVMADQPVNSHYRNDILLSFSSIDQNKHRKSFDSYAYILLNEFTPLADMQKKMTAFAAKYPAAENIKYDIFLEPVTDIHLHSVAENQFSEGPDSDLIYFLLAVAFVVLALAWINYVNLSAARSFARAKEVGVRKTAGATHRQITHQFLSETFVYNGVSILIAVVLVATCAPWFYDFVGVSFPWNKIYWLDLGATGWIVTAVFFLGMLISGLLPARLMASLPTIKVFKGTFTGGKNGAFRRSSVVLQFSCAIALLMAVIAFNRQFKVMNETSAGIDFKRTLIVLSPSNADSSFRTRLAQLRSSLQNKSVAEKVFTAGLVFETSEGWTGDVTRERNDARQPFYVNIIDPDFIDGYGLRLLAGRNFDVTDYPGEKFFQKTEPVILNKTGTVRLGFGRPEDAIGETIYWDGNECRVVGVIDDYYQRSMKKPLGPAVYTANDGSLLSLQLSSGAMGDNFKETILSIQREWDKFFPENAFEYFMLADHYESLYASERQLKNIFEFFCALAIIISCLGLFSLSLFSLNQRAKEMSIRKVLGASTKHLMHLLTKEYLFLVLVAGIIALPFTSWAVEQWLATFALRVQINANNIVIPVVLVLTFALLSIGIQTWRMVMRNPSRNLKAD